MSSSHYSAYRDPHGSHTRSIYTYAEDYHPSLHEHRLYRNKDKIIPDYLHDDYHEVNDHIRKQRPPPASSSSSFSPSPPRQHHVVVRAADHNDDHDDDGNGSGSGSGGGGGGTTNRRGHQLSKKNDKDVDYLYRTSREKFASWDIKDLDDNQEQPQQQHKQQHHFNNHSQVNHQQQMRQKQQHHHHHHHQQQQHQKSPIEKKSVLDAEVEDIFKNGTTRDSPRRKMNGTSDQREKRGRSGSASRHHHHLQQQKEKHHHRRGDRSSESLDRKSNGHRRRSPRHAAGRRSAEEPWSDDDYYEYDEDVRSNGSRNGHRHKKNNNNVIDYSNNNNKYTNGNYRNNYRNDRDEGFGSLKKKNEKNAGLNFRAIIEKFKPKSEDKERSHSRSRKQAYVDEDWRYNDYNKGRKSSSPEKYEVKSSSKSKSESTNKNHRSYQRPKERSYEVRKASPDYDDDYPHRSSSKTRLNSDSDSSKRRSYAFETSPEEFDIKIDKYEGTRGGDTELHRRSSFNGSRDSDGSSQRLLPRDRSRTNGSQVQVTRKSSMKSDKSRFKNKPPKARISERHSRPLTPPRVDQQVELLVDNFPKESRIVKESPMKKNFSMKEWYESNRSFATKYLREHSKVKELSTSSDVSARDEFIFGSPKECQTIHEIENLHQRFRKGSTDDDTGVEDHDFKVTTESIITKIRANGEKNGGMSDGCSSILSGSSKRNGDRGGASEVEDLLRGGTNGSVAGSTGSSKRNGHRMATEVEDLLRDVETIDEEPNGYGDEDDEREDLVDAGDKKRVVGQVRRNGLLHKEPAVSRRSESFTSSSSSFVMPSRKAWNYRDGGVHITDREEGQPCLKCGETCSGFVPHSWRFPTISGAELKRGFTIGKCPLEDGLDLSLAPWPGMKWACVRVLHLYCKVFDQSELFELIVRKNCTSCKCPREAHDVCHDEWVSVRARLGLKADESKEPASFDPRDAGLAWAPPGLPLHKVEEYFSMLPEVSVPRLGTTGERHRDRQLATQLPKQDLARAYCRHLEPQHSVSADDFMAARNEIALDIGSVQEVFDKAVDCGSCSNPLKYGSLAVSASKLGQLYHPTCFRCAQCNELLVDLAYCVHDDALYCERHYAEQLKPRCAACDELIFSGEYTKAMNKDWHSGHFCCWQCDESLTGQRYVLRDEHPYCIKCYESVFANGCEECHKIIGIDSKDLSYKDKHWHEACFLCNRCRVSLVDKQFGSKVDKIYCGNCYDAQFASRCDGCGEIFRAGTKKMEYKTRQWHEKCFCCVVCKNPIGTKSFIPREQEIYCAGCYEDKFATRCVKCSKIITSGGVTYKNEPWHRDCFTCSHCNQSLAGQRFTSRDEKPYCADCFGELFAKRCTSCTKPITGIGGTRFISFEDRHWHNDCFICAGCKTSLVGRGFITDGEDIICPECAKQKLS